MTERAEQIVTEARRWIGTPYRHQQSLKGVGCDCLGLVRGVWRAITGRAEPMIVPAYASAWNDGSGAETMLDAFAAHLVAVPAGEAAPGDVLVFRWRPHLPAKHCGVMSAPGRMVHAYQSAKLVAESRTLAWEPRLAAAFRFPEEAA
jgi:NlpC/P60 family putative phage cell wall peptidase